MRVDDERASDRRHSRGTRVVTGRRRASLSRARRRWRGWRATSSCQTCLCGAHRIGARPQARPLHHWSAGNGSGSVDEPRCSPMPMPSKRTAALPPPTSHFTRALPPTSRHGSYQGCVDRQRRPVGENQVTDRACHAALATLFGACARCRQQARALAGSPCGSRDASDAEPRSDGRDFATSRLAYFATCELRDLRLGDLLTSGRLSCCG